MSEESAPPADLHLLAKMPKSEFGFFYQVQRLCGKYIYTDYRQVNAAQVRELLKKRHIEEGNQVTYVVLPSGMAWLQRKNMLIDPATARVTFDHTTGQRITRVAPAETLEQACADSSKVMSTNYGHS